MCLTRGASRLSPRLVALFLLPRREVYRRCYVLLGIYRNLLSVACRNFLWESWTTSGSGKKTGCKETHETTKTRGCKQNPPRMKRKKGCKENPQRKTNEKDGLLRKPAKNTKNKNKKRGAKNTHEKNKKNRGAKETLETY